MACESHERLEERSRAHIETLQRSLDEQTAEVGRLQKRLEDATASPPVFFSAVRVEPPPTPTSLFPSDLEPSMQLCQ